MKMQKSAILVKKNFKLNIWKIKNNVKLEIIVIIEENKELLRIAYAIQNIMYPKSYYSFS